MGEGAPGLEWEPDLMPHLGPTQGHWIKEACMKSGGVNPEFLKKGCVGCMARATPGSGAHDQLDMNIPTVIHEKSKMKWVSVRNISFSKTEQIKISLSYSEAKFKGYIYTLSQEPPTPTLHGTVYGESYTVSSTV